MTTELQSLAEAERLYEQENVRVRLELLDRDQPFLWQTRGARVGRIAVTASTYGGGFRATGVAGPDAFGLFLPTRGGVEYVLDGRHVSVDAGRCAIVVAPGSDLIATFEPGYAAVGILIPRAVMEHAFGAATGAPPREPLRFDPAVDITTPAGAGIERFGSFVMREIDQRASALDSPLVAASVVDALLQVIIVGLCQGRADVRHRDAHHPVPAYLQRAEDYLTAHAAHPVTPAEVAAHAGVSVRSLQAAFRKVRGSSPARFLRERRFDLARQRLLSAPDGTVSAIALDSGFEHLGRFSTGYRARFGESPSETMRRAGTRVAEIG